jgi:hypothetical protein
MAVDPYSNEMNQMNQNMRNATARTRMQVPNTPPRLDLGEQPNIMPMRQPEQEQRIQQAQTSQQGFQPPPGLSQYQPPQRPSPGYGLGPTPAPMGQPMPQMPGQMGTMPQGAPGVPPPTGYTIQPPGVAARPEDYTYEPQQDRTWKMYPPGVAAPPHTYQVSTPHAVSTQQLGQMSSDLGRFMQQREQIRQSTQAPAPPGFANPNGVQGY